MGKGGATGEFTKYARCDENLVTKIPGAGLPDAAFGRSGVASGFSFTVRSFVFIIAGHEIHHCEGLSAHYLNGNT